MNPAEDPRKTVGPLEGLRVLDLAGEMGVYCTKLLADMGADVIKIEDPCGDETRSLPPFLHDEPDEGKSLFFMLYNTNKRGITLKLSSSDGQELFRKLAAKADIVVETFRPGYMASLGLDYSSLEKLSKGLVMASITPFGQSGPYCDYRASDLTGGAMGGAVYITGEADRWPIQPGGSESYHMVSYVAAVAILTAIHYRDVTGYGQYLDVSMQEAAAAQMESYSIFYLYQNMLIGRVGASIAHVVPGKLYRCKDGYIHIEAPQLDKWETLVKWLDDDRLKDPKLRDGHVRLQNREFIDGVIEEWAKDLTREEIFQEGQRRHIAVGPCKNAEEVSQDPHLAARSFFVDVEHPKLGRLTYPGAPYMFHESPWRVKSPAPSLGQHNREIFCSELGLSPESLATLKAAGIV